ncbi:MAG: fluoride efflux transporter CrcB [Deferribacteres bacterium]|nr:fluoride efflux transporter CrcB [Deferribacteres bacterium]
MWLEYVLIFVFGGIGCLLRYITGSVVYALTKSPLPLSTLTVNAGGSFLLALFMEISLNLIPIDPTIRTAIAVGFFGGFTTFSTFSYETVKLIEEGSVILAGLNIFFNVTICVVLAFLGFFLARKVIY